MASTNVTELTYRKEGGKRRLACLAQTQSSGASWVHHHRHQSTPIQTVIELQIDGIAFDKRSGMTPNELE